MKGMRADLMVVACAPARVPTAWATELCRLGEPADYPPHSPAVRVFLLPQSRLWWGVCSLKPQPSSRQSSSVVS